MLALTIAKKPMPFLVAAVMMAMGCQKEVSEEATHSSIEIIDDFHQKHREEVQSFTSSVSTPIVITTAAGTKIHLPASGFVTQDGKPVTGTVTVSVKEINTPGEMILNNMPTTSGGRLLESGGEYQIKVSQNNASLKLAAGNFIRIDIPSAGKDMQGMQVFNGIPDNDGNIDWSLNTNPGNVVVRDSTLFSNFSLFADDVNWINCDKFINEPTVKFTAYPGNAPGNDSTNVFVHLTGRNTVVKMNWTVGLSYFESDKLLAVPSTIVGISAKNGELYASITPVNVTDGASITMNFVRYTEQELKDRLAKLK